MKQSIYELLRELTALDGVSGQETQVVRRLAEIIRPGVDEVTVDQMGNLYAFRRGPRPGPTLALFAHSDEIGMVVKSIDPNGFIRFHTIGGTPPAVLPARTVRIAGRHLGVIGIKPGHYQTAEDVSRVKSVAESYVDVGARSAAEVDAMGIRVGDPIVLVAPLTRLTHNSDLVFGKGVDNRIACALLARLFLDDINVPAGACVGVVTVQEEVGQRGARVAAHRLQPNLAIVVDTMPAAGTPDMRRDVELDVTMGSGPVFQLMTRGYLMPPGVRNFLTQVAEAEGIPYQTSTANTSNTDAAVIQVADKGIHTGIIALPRRYSHSPVEMLDLNDAANALRLLKAIVGQIEELPEMGLVD
ncbi:MAG TPA: M42 family peptidase [bacterium]|jgi:endoglucanase